MADTANYIQSLTEALKNRADWLEKSELAKLKDELRAYQSSFSSLYTIYLKKGLINEDPYKQEAKIAELEVPDTTAFADAERLEQLSIRLSNYDNQLDFLVNFYQFGVEFLNLDRIKRILGLVRYVDWVHLTPDSHSPVTQAVSELTTQAKVGIDQIALRIIGEALTKLSRSTASIIGLLKELTDYHRENFKLEVRSSVSSGMSPQEANTANIRKKFAAAMPGKPFYPDLVEELVREDYGKDGPALRENILKSLKVPETETKAVKAPVSYKSILLEGVAVIGAASAALAECGIKLDENEALLANRKKSFWEKFRVVMQQMLNKEPEEVIYDVEFMDPTRGVPVKEKVNYHHFRGDMDKKNRLLQSLGAKGAAYSRLEAMEEEQIITFLEKNIREVQMLHKTLSGLDEFFKTEASREERDKIKGIKPELSTIKNDILRANQLRHEYSAQKEEEEQMKRLGIKTGA
jgi:hypothetical protein